MRLLELLRVVDYNLRQLVLVALGASVVALAFAFFITPTFTDTNRIRPTQQRPCRAASLLQSLGALDSLRGTAGRLKKLNVKDLTFLNSRGLQDALIDHYEQKYQSYTRLALVKNILSNAGKDGLITIEADDRYPAFVAVIANARVEDVVALVKRLAITEAQQRRVFLDNQLSSSKDKLISSERALKAASSAWTHSSPPPRRRWKALLC
jgi:hypothetical protein